MVLFEVTSCIPERRTASDSELELEPSPRFVKRFRSRQWEQYLLEDGLTADQARTAYLTHARIEILEGRKSSRPFWVLNSPSRKIEMQRHFRLPSVDDMRDFNAALERERAAQSNYSDVMEGILPASPSPSMASTASFSNSTSSYTASTAPTSPDVYEIEMDCEATPAFSSPSPSQMANPCDWSEPIEIDEAPLPDPEEIEVDEVAEVVEDSVEDMILEAEPEERSTATPLTVPSKVQPNALSTQPRELSQGVPCKIGGQISKEELQRILASPSPNNTTEPISKPASEPAVAPKPDVSPKRAQETKRGGLSQGQQFNMNGMVDPVFLASIMAGTHIASTAPKTASKSTAPDTTVPENISTDVAPVEFTPKKEASTETEPESSSKESLVVTPQTIPAGSGNPAIESSSSTKLDAPIPPIAPSQRASPQASPTMASPKKTTKSPSKAIDPLKSKSGSSEVPKSTHISTASTSPTPKSGGSIAQATERPSIYTTPLRELVSGNCAPAVTQLAFEGTNLLEKGGWVEQFIDGVLKETYLTKDPESVFGTLRIDDKEE